MIMYHLGPQLGVWIMQVSTFSRVLINRFHCMYNDLGHFATMIGFVTLPSFCTIVDIFIKGGKVTKLIIVVKWPVNYVLYSR